MPSCQVPSAKPNRSDSGSSIVEFALILILFLLLTGVVVQGAFLFNAWLVLTNAVREGARAGAPCINRTVQGCSQSDIQSLVRQAAQGVDQTQLAPAGAITTSVVTDSTNTKLLTVGVPTYNVPVMVPLFDSIFPSGSIAISASSAMRLENQG